MAQYLAEETVALSHGESLAADHESIDQAEKQASEARQRLAQAQQTWATFSGREPIEALQARSIRAWNCRPNCDSNWWTRKPTSRNIRSSRIRAIRTGAIARLRGPSGGARKRLQELERSIQEKSVTIATRARRRDAAAERSKNGANHVRSARRKRSGELRADGGTQRRAAARDRSGIVPQRPSSPNVPLNVAAASVCCAGCVDRLSQLRVCQAGESVGFEPAVPRGMRA